MNTVKQFIESICNDTHLKRTILEGYALIFEGISDMTRTFDANDVINDILVKFGGGRRAFGTQLETHPMGFQYCRSDYMYGIDLNIRWIIYNPDIEQKSQFNPNNNFIFIIMDEYDNYDGSRNSILKIVEHHRETLAHEIQHWVDDTLYKLTPTRYTHRSQIEDPELIDIISKINNSIDGLVNDKYTKSIDALNKGELPDNQYYNSQLELNGNIMEFIYRMLSRYMKLDKDGKVSNYVIPFDDIVKHVDASIGFDNLTPDSKKRLIKRLYIFHSALSKIDKLHSVSTDKLKKELITYFTSDKAPMDRSRRTKLESIEYTHNDVMNDRDITFFEANYKFDSDYRQWFDKKYCKPGYCMALALAESVRSINSTIMSKS